MNLQIIIFIAIVSVDKSWQHSTQRPSSDDDDSNPFLDMATTFLQETIANQNGGGNGLGGIASLIGNMMQPDGAAGKSDGGGIGAAQIISGIGSLMANSGGSGGGFDPSIISNVLEMFTSSNSDTDANGRQKRSNDAQNGGIGIDTIINIASAFINTNKEQGRGSNDAQDGLMSLLPMVVQAYNSFTGPEGDEIHAKHKEHAWVLPPFLEKIHVIWDHFSNSELAEALWKKSGVHSIFKGFTGRDGKLDYDRLFSSLHNQSFRRRWLKTFILYMADWANYIADPAVYQRYFGTAQLMFNGFLQSQGIPKHALFDPTRPSETLSTLVDHVSRQHLNAKIASITYVKPAVNYVKDLFKLGKARGLLQKFNATELSDKLTDTVNLEVIEPVLKVHRAYRFATRTPHCDKYVMCELNSHDPNEQLGLAGIKPGITKFGSMAAAWFISSETGTPFWTLFGVINEPYNCQVRFPVDCADFHDGEAKVTTEYIHNEL
ncbi:uncharacterized protein LOC119082013 [Bradysia coprophila]|uniref:uncharacterized protein LOC119082013 n=1 Tax=Bradysia coprophila TaxID=38358 RepID=UPI00187D7A9C|nr:uncharacterized protein LOC119082013 [Bradysia coprophila]